MFISSAYAHVKSEEVKVFLKLYKSSLALPGKSALISYNDYEANALYVY